MARTVLRYYHSIFCPFSWQRLFRLFQPSVSSVLFCPVNPPRNLSRLVTCLSLQGRGKDVLTKVSLNAPPVDVWHRVCAAAIARSSLQPLLLRVCVLGLSGAAAKTYASATRARGNVKCIQGHRKSLNEGQTKPVEECGGYLSSIRCCRT